MGFYKYCDDPECTYDDPNEGRTRLDAPTLRETLLGRYRCHKCNARQELEPYAKEQAMEEWFDKMEALEARVEELEARLDIGG